jgi:mono/diheme cytochrome c family protein
MSPRGDEMKSNDRLQCACVLTSLLVAGNFGAQGALAADADNGRRIAQMRCSPCHIVVPNQRQEVTNSPPFDVIARKNDFNAEMLAYLILSPHPRMNMTLTRSEADDLAAYIALLRK